MRKFVYKKYKIAIRSRPYYEFVGGPFDSCGARLTGGANTLTFKVRGLDGEFYKGHYSGACWVPFNRRGRTGCEN
jgi:hypothetical protein